MDADCSSRLSSGRLDVVTPTQAETRPFVVVPGGRGKKKEAGAGTPAPPDVAPTLALLRELGLQ